MGGSMQHNLLQVWPINGLDTNADWHGSNKCCLVFKDKTTTSSQAEKPDVYYFMNVQK